MGKRIKAMELNGQRYVPKADYRKLWHLLIDLDLKKKDLAEIAGISSSSVTKMRNGGVVSTMTLEKICIALGCDIKDIMEISWSKEEVNEQFQ